MESEFLQSNNRGAVHNAEGFLGRVKTESVYPEHREECARDEVLVLIDDYIHWYNHARIKRSFGWMSPVECRQKTKEGLRDCLQENVRSTFFHAECGGEFDDPGIGEPLGVFGVERPLSCKGNSCGNAVVESTCVSAGCRPAIPQPAPQSPPSAPSWDVPSADSSATFPDVL
ncbi:IS3 family transposase [Bifidobacterium longum]|uniref:IS3 family transposase n=1 Tax=Bifidobacterium longum TaxID=216816 RepID=UPI0023B96264|nr:IS3 family transposase [Bifidobacterium longum]